MSTAIPKEVFVWCGAWFFTNLTITFYNKYALSGLDFSPLQNTLSHMIGTFIGCVIVRRGQFPSLTAAEFKRLSLYSFIFAFNIVYSQLGIKLTSLSLNQVCRASTPLYQATLEWILMGIIHRKYNLIPLLPVCAGVAMTSMGEIQLTFVSLFVSISSVIVSALKGVLSMKILQRDLKLKLTEYSFLMIVTPLATMWICIAEFAIIRPFGLLSTAADAVAVNSNAAAADAVIGISNQWNIANLRTMLPIISGDKLLYLSIGAVLAFAVNVASFGTVKRTSATAMGVMANAKQAITILLAMLIAEGNWTVMKLFGIIVTISGAFWYGYRKDQSRKMKAATKENVV